MIYVKNIYDIKIRFIYCKTYKLSHEIIHSDKTVLIQIMNFHISCKFHVNNI